MPTIRPFNDDGGDWDDGDGDWGDDDPGENLPGTDLPGESYPGGEYPGEGNTDHGFPDHGSIDHESFEGYMEGDRLVATLTVAIDKGMIDGEDFRDFDDWTRPDSANSSADAPGSSPHSGQAVLSPAPSSPSSSTSAIQANAPSWSDAKYSLQVSNGIGWGAGYAFFVGPSGALQYQISLGKRDTEIGASAFVGAFGMGGFIAPPMPIPTFTANVQFSPSSSAVATVNIGCVRSVIVVMPLVSLQLSETEYGNGLLNDVSLSVGATFGLGIFGGVSCATTLRSPSW